MPMPNITFKDYIEGIKAKYEEEKTKNYSGYLAKPSPAQLKNLCDILKKKNTSKIDQEIISSFYSTIGFDIDKFRPIGNFFSGKTQAPSHDILDMMALLVDFEPRPLGKFLEKNNQQSEEDIKSKIVTYDSSDDKVPINIPSRKNLVEIENNSLQHNQIEKSSFNKKITFAILLTFFLFAAVLIYNNVTAHKNCLEWKEDRYIEVDCNTEMSGFVNLNSNIPFNENLLKLRKIIPTDTTSFFKDGKATLWYCKDSNGNLEFFNAPGYHPITNKPLKHVTNYIIEKYLQKESN